MNKIVYNKIISGDCLEVLKSMPLSSVDLVITSPPYFQQREYGGIGIGNERYELDYIENLLNMFGLCLRLVKNTGSIVINIGDKYQDGSLSLIPDKFAIEVLKRYKVKLINKVTWLKLNPTPRQDQRKLVQSTEPFFIFSKTENYYWDHYAFMSEIDKVRTKRNVKKSTGIGKSYFELINNSELSESEKLNAKKELEKTICDVLEGRIESFRMKIRNIHAEPYGGQNGGRKIQLEKNGFTIIRLSGRGMRKDVIESPVESIKGNAHPAVYPLYVVKQFIKLLTMPEAIVLDPFCGSGTSCIAAKMLDRKYIGIEINDDYVEYAQKRLSGLEENKFKGLFK